MERTPAHPVDPQFIERWSPRAFTGESLAQEDLLRLFEAARWAPSCANRQPWRVVYGHRGTPEFDALFALLVEGNQKWCAQASVLVAIFAKTKGEDGSDWSATAPFDTGAAWMSLALQAHLQGLVVHAMAGVHYGKMNETLGAPREWVPQCMVALGRRGSVEALPEQLRQREQPNDREPLEQHVFLGKVSS